MSLLYVDPANKHDITIVKERVEDFVRGLGVVLFFLIRVMLMRVLRRL